MFVLAAGIPYVAVAAIAYKLGMNYAHVLSSLQFGYDTVKPGRRLTR